MPAAGGEHSEEVVVLGPLTDSRQVGLVISAACAAAALVSPVLAVVTTPWSLVGLPIAAASWYSFGYRYLRPALLVEGRLVCSRWPGHVASVPRQDIINAGYRQVASIQAPQLMVIELKGGRRMKLWGSWGRVDEAESLNDLLQNWRIVGTTDQTAPDN